MVYTFSCQHALSNSGWVAIKTGRVHIGESSADIRQSASVQGLPFKGATCVNSP